MLLLYHAHTEPRRAFTLNRIVKKPLVIEITNRFLPGEITHKNLADQNKADPSMQMDVIIFVLIYCIV